MAVNNTNIITQLINEYGIIEIEKLVQLDKEILTYIYNTRFKDTINEEQSSFLYSEDNDEQIFTNEKTSVFCLNKKLVNLNLLVKNKAVGLSNSLFVNPIDIQRYFNKSKQLFGNNSSETIILNRDAFIFKDHKHSDIENIPINEYKLIKLLLENPKIYISSKNPIIYAEGENGYAYVLGKRNGSQLKF